MADNKELRETLARTVAAGLDRENVEDMENKLKALFPAAMPAADKAGILAETYIYSLGANVPGNPPDGVPGYLPPDADLKAAVLNEIRAMKKADFDEEERRDAWSDLENKLAAAPQSDFIPGADVNCPDDYILSLKRLSCQDALNLYNIKVM